jgi:5-methyltetrahydropteroyltriglutamate--homocysteine methyltransferase
VTNRILTTHTGSLPRRSDLAEMLEARARGETIDEDRFARRVADEVRNVVGKQAQAGLDIVNDGETSKYSYAAYVKERLSGFSKTSKPRTVVLADAKDFPTFAARRQTSSPLLVPTCEGPVTYVGDAALQTDIANLRSALRGVEVSGAFMTAASPGVIARFIPNAYYPYHNTYLTAIADAMKTEYETIVAAGYLLQVDCPDLTGKRDIPGMAPGTDYMQMHLDALERALGGIPPERMRIHLCWGNYAGPYHLDTPLQDIIDRVYTTRPAAISLEGANPRHGHEWKVFADHPHPTGRSVIPGVLDSTTNFIEHPELVKQRLLNYASQVGRDRVIAGVDCGFATSVTSTTVDPEIVWAKLASMVEGARMASAELW